MHRLLTMVLALAVVSTQLDAKEACADWPGEGRACVTWKAQGMCSNIHVRQKCARTCGECQAGPEPSKDNDSKIKAEINTPSGVSQLTSKTRRQEDCYTGRPDSYRGTVHHTVDGLECQRWDSQYPHPHMYNKTSYFTDGKLPENYCRTFVGRSHQPVCHTTDPDKKWDWCDVKECVKEVCKVTPVTPVNPLSAKMTSEQLFEVTPNADTDHVKDIVVTGDDVTGDDAPLVILPSGDLLANPKLDPKDRKAVIKDIGKSVTLPSPLTSRLLTLQAAAQLDIFLHKSADGNNKVVTLFHPKPDTDYRELLGDELRLFDVVKFTSVDQIKTAAVPVYVVAAGGSAVEAKKC